MVRILLDAGASPNTNDGGRPLYHSPEGERWRVDDPDITELLLGGVADPDPASPSVRPPT
ncbi:MAG: hypothetical protein M3159_09865 [Actinomycetota bacterium]|nr:hypothetical protein [Actinomycetota bacterium]